MTDYYTDGPAWVGGVSNPSVNWEERALAAEAERDALRAQLDAMTTELRASTLAIDERGRVKVGQVPRFMTRRVGPWVEVTD